MYTLILVDRMENTKSIYTLTSHEWCMVHMIWQSYTRVVSYRNMATTAHQKVSYTYI